MIKFGEEASCIVAYTMRLRRDTLCDFVPDLSLQLSMLYYLDKASFEFEVRKPMAKCFQSME
jgi:hypothetical protein